MKKITILMLTILILLGISGCTKPKYEVGDTVSTDILDFTLENAQFSYYGDGSSPETFAMPSEEDLGYSYASNGHILVGMTFTLINKDRVSIKVGEAQDGSYQLRFKVKYGGKEYELKRYEKNSKESIDLDLRGTAVRFNNTIFYINYEPYKVMAPTDELTIRILVELPFEPKKLSDPFTITINVLNSFGEYEEFTYTVNK